MTHRFYHRNPVRNATVTRPVHVRIFVWFAIIAIAGMLVACAFVVSARQHFDAVQLGYDSQKLKEEALKLEQKKRALEYDLASAASPVEIERRAKKMGLARPAPPADDVKGAKKAAPPGARREAGR